MIGPSGSTKSIHAVATALTYATGVPIGPYRANETGAALILDGEASRRDLNDIALAIGRGHGIDIATLEQSGALQYRRITETIIGQAETLRLHIEREGIGLLEVDSLDTARGGDASHTSGPYYDTLRHVGVSSLSVDHIPDTMRVESMSNWRALGSVRSTNRPRRTWAMKARPPEDGLVRVRHRLNWANLGPPGEEFEITLAFEMRNGRFWKITFSEPTSVKRDAPSNAERALIAARMVERRGDQPDNKGLRALTNFTDPQTRSALQTARRNGWITEAGTPLRVTPVGENHLLQKWSGGELPDPKEGSDG